LAHGLGVVVEAPLRLFQHMLMLSARNSPLLAGCAASFECTVSADVSSIAS
jgi:flavin reductase (DIM6/NTAB) family NADH-FMN oxidoreductase RutF